MYSSARGRGRGRGRISISGLSPTAVNEEGKLLSELVSGPPATYPEVIRLPLLPEIDGTTAKLLDRWHKLRHVYRSGPYFVTTEAEGKSAEEDPFAVKKYARSPLNTKERPPLTAIVTLCSYYFPDELSSKKQRTASSRFASSSDTMKVFWLDQLKCEKEIDRLDDLAKRTEEEKPGGALLLSVPREKLQGVQTDESENEMDDLAQEQGEDEYSGNDYEQGEYFDDDEEYEDVEDAGDDDGPVY